MKKTIKNAILGGLFALCCVFTFFTCSFMSIQTNAIENENQEEVVENEEETQEEVEQPNETEENNKDENVDVEQETEKENNENNENNENQEQETPVEDEEITKEELKEEIEEKLVEIKDWIIALIASFLGTSGLVAFVKILLNKWFNTQQTNLKAKLDQMEQEKKIAVEQKEVILEQFNKLTEQFNQVLEYNEKLCYYISSKIKVDEEKLFKTNQLLQSLLPIIPEEEKSDTNEE